jgi:Striatin family
MSAMRKQQQTNPNSQNTALIEAFRRINYTSTPTAAQVPPAINGTANINDPGNGNGRSSEDGLANYTLQGVMQWLNGEYRRYERDRNVWEIEKASLQVGIFVRSY